jgi:toxin ParE1/3/4
VTDVIWTPPAEAELEAIAEYIAKDNPAAAVRVARTVRESAALLVDFPNRGRHGRIGNTRELPVLRTRYIISYRVTGDTVWVVSVFDSAREDPTEALH